MISVQDALSRLFDLVTPMPTETAHLAQANGRWLATPAIASRDQPPFDASAMDGYAICGAALPGATFEIIGTSAAGHGWQGRLFPGQALRIFTGAPVPEGAERVVMQEDVTATPARITLSERLDLSGHIRAKGQDFRIGDAVSPRRLRPADVALLAAMNIAEVTVTRRPVVAIIATGDELVMPGESPAPDQIIASNSFALKAMVEDTGAVARMLPIARDTERSLAAVFDLAADADLIVTSGGASVGDHDLVGKTADALGMERAFYKIAMRPGKPLMAGRLRGIPMLGLPGNPVSSIVCGHVFMLPMIRAMQGAGKIAQTPQRAVLGSDTPANGPRAHYMRARLQHGDGGLLIFPYERQDSALLGVMAAADALMIRPVGGAALPAGAVVEYLPI